MTKWFLKRDQWVFRFFFGFFVFRNKAWNQVIQPTEFTRTIDRLFTLCDPIVSYISNALQASYSELER